MIPPKWMVVLMAVGTLMTPVVSAVNTCSWLTAGGEECVRDVDCSSSGGVGIYIWENCETGKELFTITNDTISIASDCAYASGNPKVTLSEQLDAEDEIKKSCDINIENIPSLKLFFEILNFNEFSPTPTKDTVSTIEVNIDENKDPGVEMQIYYTDDDLGETEGLTCEQITSENGNIFVLEPVDDGNSNIKTFNLRVKEKLDFEEKVFYKMEYNIISTDERGYQKNAKQTFFIYVKDMPDEAPFWSQREPVYTLSECRENETLFTVTAQDRDVEVNYAIKYSMVEDPVSGYFSTTENTGDVLRIKPIDREDLLDQGISSFRLTITATEYKSPDEIGEEPNSNEQVTIITIEDCNNKIPKFDKPSYEITMKELTDDSGNQDLDLIITVTDMDEGINGSFTLKTSDKDRLAITPVAGQQTAEVKLTALWESSTNNYFNYEVHRDTQLNFTITATEDKDSSHVDTASVTIFLLDVNDNNPKFELSSYEKNVKENTTQNTMLLQVVAKDEDVSADFGTPSIRYNLAGSCYQLEIDNTTGWVTLVSDLDYDDPTTDNEIHCIVTARDMYGEDQSGTSEIIISVIDVVDETPRFVVESEIPMSIEENSAKGEEVGTFIVTDTDKGANVDFTIVSSECSGSVSTIKDVEGWFTVVAGTPNYPQHQGIVQVNGAIDREVCNAVKLVVMADDLETEEGVSNDNGTVIITIQDVKDESPIFKGDYSALDIDEFDENDVPEESMFVFQVTVSDPDEGDTIHLSISKGDKNVDLQLSETTVTVLSGGEATVNAMTKAGTEIDREKQDTIEVEITLTNDDEKYSTSKNFQVMINDLNDKTPTMKEDLCGKSVNVSEDDGTDSVDGTYVYTILATDDDTESPYNTVSYKLINDELDDSTPFQVDGTTGDVTVFLSDTRHLDRETVPQWELQFRASDQCKQPIDATCKVLSSSPPCTVTVFVDDVNDNAPRDLTWTPDKNIEVTDFLAEDEDLGYVLWAVDDDVGENASLSYEVVSTVFYETGEEKDLFYAEDEIITDKTSCRLFATQNFMGMNLTGRYNVTLEARDGGGLATNFSFLIIVNDANDHAPYFEFDTCPDAGPNTIVMAENAYTPGENGQDNPMEVSCAKPGGIPFNIRVNDDDTQPVNTDVIVEIDRANSSIANAKNETVQLSYWSLEPSDCKGGCHLKVSHKIDREEGTPYNLSLHVRNTAEDPVQETWAMLQVVVTNVKEYDPYFCSEGHCSQIVYIYENNPDASQNFMSATDMDNTNIQPGDVEYDEVYYFIMGGDTSYFTIPSDRQNKIILNKNQLPNGLDREQRQNYSLYILATNEALGGNTPMDDFTKNNTLRLIIHVGDVNDEAPTFNEDVIFSSFMQTNKNEDRLTTIEALDADLNETLTYEIVGEQEWIGTDMPFDGKFTLERQDERSVNLKLGFDPTALTKGYCNFTLLVEDKVKHTDEAQVKVYIITDEYQVAAYFYNTAEDVKNKKTEIQDAFSKAYSVQDDEYVCVIDSITATQTDSGEALANETTIYMHFIDDEMNEPVKEQRILDLTDNANVMTELRDRLESIKIELISVGTYNPPESGKNIEDTVLTLKILLGVVSLVLGALLVLVITIYCIRTRSLTRKVKVLSTNTFGSKASGLNQMGMDMVPVPGSNLAKVHGNHNPVFSENEAFEYRNQDTGSISSGDSVLVGVEDNPEFKSYAAKSSTHTSQGYENPSFGRSIDEVSAPPPGVQGGMKGNPLLNLGGLQDDTPSSNAFGDSDVSEGDAASLDQKMNSNFTFS